MTCVISNELAEFFNNNGSKIKMSRVDVTRRIDKYIEEHGLRFCRTINPDEKLKKLLKCGDNIVTFANLQSYIAPHILLEPKIVPPPPSAPPLSPEPKHEEEEEEKEKEEEESAAYSVYAVLPEDEFPEPPAPLSPSIYAVFPEDEIIEVPNPQIAVAVAVAVAGGFSYFD